MSNNGASKNLQVSIAVQYATPSQKEWAVHLASRLHLPLVSADGDSDFILRCSEDGLELFQTLDPSLTGSIRAEFILGPAGYRRQQSGSEMLIRAIGLKMNKAPCVLDATGGLGRDAFIMADHGCRVYVIEKHPIIAALLEDGLSRAEKDPQTKSIVDRISMTVGNSINFLAKKGNETEFDAIYLDPMFPSRKKTARVKKELQILQMLVGDDDHGEELFAAALDRPAKRIVVKRPAAAPFLQNRKPSHSLSGKTVRFDVYLASG